MLIKRSEEFQPGLGHRCGTLRNRRHRCGAEWPLGQKVLHVHTFQYDSGQSPHIFMVIPNRV